MAYCFAWVEMADDIRKLVTRISGRWNGMVLAQPIGYVREAPRVTVTQGFSDESDGWQVLKSKGCGGSCV